MKDLEGVSAQAFSDAIGAIYDCALDPGKWPEAMRRITELTAGAAMGMGTIDHKYKLFESLNHCSQTMGTPFMSL